MHTVHENFVHPSELWHLSNFDDSVTVETINCHLEKCGAIEVVLVLVPVHTKQSIRNSKCRVNEVGELVAAEDGRMITRMAYPKYNYT
jgi:hypothetical protein